MPETTVHWQWEEAFDKFGFGDGDGLNFTGEVVAFLKELGYECDCGGGMHNWMIQSITKGDQTWEFTGYPEDEDEDDPRKALPPELVKALDEKFA